MVKDKIIEKLKDLTGLENVNLSFSDKVEHGDYTTNVAMQKKGENPRNYATDLSQKIQSSKELMSIIDKVEVAGPGFINFYLSKDVYKNELESILKEKDRYGESSVNKGKKVVVEYSSPNIAKPFTIGHLRSTIIGDAIANLLVATGWEVYRDNHLGDWGTQFGKLIYKLKGTSLDSNLTIKDLVNMYIEFHKEAEDDASLEEKAREEFKKLEEGDPESRKYWQFCIDISLKEFNKIYRELGIKFTENKGIGYGESFFEDKMPQVLVELNEKGLLKKGEEGAELVFFEEDKYPPLMIVKKDGTSLYATRDLATDKFRLKEYGKDVAIINEVGAEQSLYFQQLYEVERLLGWVTEGQRIHIKHGHFRFADKKMSTRKGNVIWLEDVLNESLDRAKKLGSDTEKVANIVSIGALKWNELKRDSIKDIVFDWDEILNMKGNSGPYLQYTTVRIKSLLSKASDISETIGQELNESELNLVRHLARFPEIVTLSSNEYRPSALCEFLYNLSQKYNLFYDSGKIIGEEREAIGLSLSLATLTVLQKGLSLLGIQTPDKM